MANDERYTRANSRATVASAIVAILALGWSVYTFQQNQVLQTDRDELQGKVFALEQQKQSAGARSERESEARKVQLTEAPSCAYKNEGPRKLAPGQGFWDSVTNRNELGITDVWVDDARGRSVVMGTVQAGTFYALPTGFRGQVVHFTDSRGTRWRIDRHGELAEDPQGREPDKDPDLTSPFTLRLDCTS